MNEKNAPKLTKTSSVKTVFIGFIGFLLGSVIGVFIGFVIGIPFYRFFLSGHSDSMAGAGAFGLMIIAIGILVGGFLGYVNLPKFLDKISD